MSDTSLYLHGANGSVIAQEKIGIPMSGSRTIWPHEVFGMQAIQRAGEGGYVLIRDTTCRLFGYHGRMIRREGRFSVDHMFGF